MQSFLMPFFRREKAFLLKGDAHGTGVIAQRTGCARSGGFFRRGDPSGSQYGTRDEEYRRA